MSMELAYDLAESCDLFLMIGSSLAVQPAASVPLVAHQAGAPLIFINRTETEYDALAEVVVRGSASEFMSDLLAELS